MQNFQDTFETRKRSFISAFSICMTVPLMTVIYIYFRRTEVFCKKGVLKDFTKLTGTHLHRGASFLRKLQATPATLLKKRLRHRCFPVKFVKKKFRIASLQNTFSGYFCYFEKQSSYGRSVHSSFSKIKVKRHKIYFSQIGFLKDALSCPRQFLATENPLKMMKNGFYFTLKALFLLKIFKSFSLHFGHVENQLDQKDKVNFNVFDVTTSLIDYCHTHTDQYLKN